MELNSLGQENIEVHKILFSLTGNWKNPESILNASKLYIGSSPIDTSGGSMQLTKNANGSISGEIIFATPLKMSAGDSKILTFLTNISSLQNKNEQLWIRSALEKTNTMGVTWSIEGQSIYSNYTKSGDVPSIDIKY